jgi:hypothetical protein
MGGPAEATPLIVDIEPAAAGLSAKAATGVQISLHRGDVRRAGAAAAACQLGAGSVPP